MFVLIFPVCIFRFANGCKIWMRDLGGLFILLSFWVLLGFFWMFGSFDGIRIEMLSLVGCSRWTVALLRF